MTSSSIEAKGSKVSIGVLVACFIAVANLALIWLSWFPWFGGSEQHVGIADKLFGQMRLSGFRADIVWLCLSTGVLFFAGCFFILQARRSRNARVSAALCVAEVLSFAMYILRALTSGLLYFG
jgi:hypothetical protein